MNANPPPKRGSLSAILFFILAGVGFCVGLDHFLSGVWAETNLHSYSPVENHILAALHTVGGLLLSGLGVLVAAAAALLRK